MTNTETVARVQEQVLEGVQKSQESIVEAVQAWADAVKRLTPSLPTSSNLTEKLPQPAELIDNAYDFAGQLLAAQRQFAHELLQATTTVTEPAKQASE